MALNWFHVSLIGAEINRRKVLTKTVIPRTQVSSGPGVGARVRSAAGVWASERLLWGVAGLHPLTLAERVPNPNGKQFSSLNTQLDGEQVHLEVSPVGHLGPPCGDVARPASSATTRLAAGRRPWHVAGARAQTRHASTAVPSARPGPPAVTALVTRCGWEPRSHHVTGHFSGKTDSGSFWVNPGLKKEPWRQIKERRRSPRKITSLPWSRLLAQELPVGLGGPEPPPAEGHGRAQMYGLTRAPRTPSGPVGVGAAEGLSGWRCCCSEHPVHGRPGSGRTSPAVWEPGPHAGPRARHMPSPRC